MGSRNLGMNVFDAAMTRMRELYARGDRVVVSFSAGKDSGVCVELCVMAAREEGRLPIDVVMRDEEIMFPGTFEYAERVAARPEINFHWVIANQPILNAFNRADPYFWTFDPELSPDEWVRRPPDIAKQIAEKNIEALVTPEKFPIKDGQRLFDVVGLRTQESVRRKLGLHSSGGYLTGENRWGIRKCRPIYDWTDGDVWLAHQRFGWDYNHAYDVMNRMGVPRNNLRIAPPTLNVAGLNTLKVAAAAWPRWFERVCARLDGIRSAAQFGRRACSPIRRSGESWEDCYRRTCIEEAPDWIAERAKHAADYYSKRHPVHSTEPFPQVKACPNCPGGRSVASWRALASAMWSGDPFCMKVTAIGLPYIEPEFFRPGAGTWGGGKPSW